MMVTILSFFFIILFQVMVLKKVVLFNTGFCYIYIAFLLLLPIETNPVALMGIAFLLGLMIDIFYDSLGIHSSSSVLIAYLRNYWLDIITPQGGYEIGAGPTLQANGVQWFLVYSLPLVFIHHATLFFTEAGGFDLFGFTSMKILASVLFTFSLIILHQLISGKRKR